MFLFRCELGVQSARPYASTVRAVRLQYGEDEEAFRAELVAWLEENAPPPDVLAQQRQSSADLTGWGRAWQRAVRCRLARARWPPELGGRNASASEQMIYFEEMTRRDIPRSCNPQGLGIISPSLHDYGTPEQRERWLLPTLRGEIAWCLGMSEPGAGSDLASLQTRAVLDGDQFVVNGQKVWTSGAHHADWCMCFVRTDPDAPKHKGISVLIIDMKSPGVEARPFAELTEPDWCDFNEVFFTDVRVPKEHLLGELNAGWALTQGSLAHERAMLWIDYAYLVQRSLRALIALGDRLNGSGRPLREDDRFRDLVASFHVDSEALLLMGYRGFSKFMRGRAAPRSTHCSSCTGAKVMQEILLAGAGCRAPMGSTWTSSAPRCGATVHGSTSTCGRSRARSRWHERDPAQHHRRARARLPRR